MRRIAENGVQTFGGSLAQLFPVLRTELAHSPRGTWVRRQLRRGACVSLAKDAANRRVLLLSRSRALPADDERAASMWAGEVQTFLRWFGAQHWEMLTELPAKAFDEIDVGVWSAYIEPEEGRRGATS